ncbi:DUF2273 domain-containing protein [Natranaerobius trueperi]|uniref:DUF2273 domain-containing protein n=1 Tax=Natranaerobius trueperi TaxID=759412 RepID=A0A226BYL4_9FIRM|nr:DUF2273 domain-containing protein [Natranaerobius trueperi]OWZ84021.1 hypothetical protein CDO51_05540 [Natranaerobius trueperi]
MNREYIMYLLENYLGRIIGVVLGFLISLIFVIFGFLQGLLVLILMGVGFYFGYYWDKEKQLPISIHRFLPPRR